MAREPGVDIAVREKKNVELRFLEQFKEDFYLASWTRHLVVEISISHSKLSPASITSLTSCPSAFLV